MNTNEILHNIENEYDDKDPDFVYKKMLLLVRTAKEEYLGGSLSPYAILPVLKDIHGLTYHSYHEFSHKQIVTIMDRCAKDLPISDILIESMLGLASDVDFNDEKLRAKLIKLISNASKRVDIHFANLAAGLQSVPFYEYQQDNYAISSARTDAEALILIDAVKDAEDLGSYTALFELSCNGGHDNDTAAEVILRLKYKELLAEHEENGWSPFSLIKDAAKLGDSEAFVYLLQNANLVDFEHLITALEAREIPRNAALNASITSFGRRAKAHENKISSVLIYALFHGDLSPANTAVIESKKRGFLGIEEKALKHMNKLIQNKTKCPPLRDAGVELLSRMYDAGKINAGDKNHLSDKIFAKSAKYKKDKMNKEFTI